MYITPFTNLFSTSIVNCLQSPKEVFVRGLVNLVHAVDYLFCLNLPSASSQLRTKTLCWLCMFMKTKYAMISRFQSDLSFVTIEQIISSIHILRKCKIPRKFPFPMKLFWECWKLYRSLWKLRRVSSVGCRRHRQYISSTVEEWTPARSERVVFVSVESSSSTVSSSIYYTDSHSVSLSVVANQNNDFL